MMQNLIQSSLFYASVSAAFLHQDAVNARAVELPKVVHLIPSDAEAALIVPNLAAFSDELLTCLEGMDRAHLLLGARPLDQIKSLSGFNIGVNDNGSAAIVLREAQEDHLCLDYILPVTDVEAFVRGNFVESLGAVHRRADGRAFYIARLDSHVMVSSREANVGPAGDFESFIRQTLGDQLEFAQRGDAFIFLRRGAVDRGLRHVDLAPLRAIARDVSGVVMTLDFDPLGLVVRSLAMFADESPWREVASNPASASRLEKLPHKPFYVALGANLSGVPAPLIPSWLKGATTVQFAAPPSSAGLAGGLLNEAVLVIEAGNPGALKAALKKQVMALQAQGRIHEWNWQENVANDDRFVADKYEIKLREASGPMQMLQPMLFGRAGWRGHVHEASDALSITFSQRPALVQTLVATKSVDSLEAMPVVKSMRSWLPQHPVLEVYLNAGHLSEFVRQAAAQYKLDAEVPAWIGSPPVAFGMSFTNGTAETATIVPAPCLATLLDEMSKRFMPQPAPP